LVLQPPHHRQPPQRIASERRNHRSPKPSTTFATKSARSCRYIMSAFPPLLKEERTSRRDRESDVHDPKRCSRARSPREFVIDCRTASHNDRPPSRTSLRFDAEALPLEPISGGFKTSGQ